MFSRYLTNVTLRGIEGKGNGSARKGEGILKKRKGQGRKGEVRGGEGRAGEGGGR